LTGSIITIPSGLLYIPSFAASYRGIVAVHAWYREIGHTMKGYCPRSFPSILIQLTLFGWGEEYLASRYQRAHPYRTGSSCCSFRISPHQ
jgi:hypothetical protein